MKENSHLEKAKAPTKEENSPDFLENIKSCDDVEFENEGVTFIFDEPCSIRQDEFK